ncbi:transposase [Levilactobacillus namurensis]|uniref:Transposase n=1 Tax=Levilactobacillus namurensis TaxID=380393 RepID=A0AAW8W830_9LACO|nr:transposase [Levilactobacillus namurensis]MDT7014913.1 transposase [Levilactobacillus namurensis]
MTWRDDSETHFHRILVASGVPLPEPSRYNRCCRELVAFERYICFRLLNQYRRLTQYEVIDSAPITLASARRSQEVKALRPLANKGFNAIKQLYFYGFKLHVVIYDQGFPLNWEITEASVDDRKATEELLLTVPAKHVLADAVILVRP